MIENQLKTIILLGALTALLLWIGSFWGGSGLTVALIFVMLMNLGSYFYSDRIVLAMYRAKEVKRSEAPKLHDMVEDVAKKAGIPKPRMFIVPSDNPNAFATGRNPKNAVVACTKGILNLLSENELKGVIAHEMSHIKNRDILIQTIASTIAGVIGYVAMMARWSAMFGFGGRDRDNNIFGLIVLAIVMPLLATLIRLAISRSREFLADEAGAKTLKQSDGLASALQKLDEYSKKVPMKFGNNATSSLFIVNPFRGQSFANLLSTHPSTQKRVQKLRRLSF